MIHTSSKSEIAIWHLTETIDKLMLLANEHHVDVRNSFYKNEQQHKEYLASRIALKLINQNFIVEETIEKNAPKLKNNLASISISHCKKMCAVISNFIKPVGIDVEVISPRILNVSKRFMNNDELSFISKNQNENLKMQFVIWSCKEAVFKKYHSQHLDFRENMSVEFFDLNELQHVFCEIKTNNIYIREKISVHFFDDIILAHSI